MGGSRSGADVARGVLKHYGVKGMKWGVRRTRKQIDSASDDAKKASAAKKTAKSSGTQALSNNELQSLVTRMNLEQQYSRLSSSPSQKSAGQKFVTDVLGNVAKQQATRVANDLASRQIGELLNK